MKNYISIDWGQKKIGVAFGNDETKIAFGAEMIENDALKSHGVKVFDNLIKLAHDHDASTFVIGCTSHDGQNDNVTPVEDFIRSIEEKSALEVVRANEMMTTKQAHANLKNAGKKNIAKLDDVEAARIILQEFFDTL